MVRYIQAELYRLRHRRFTLFLLIIGLMTSMTAGMVQGRAFFLLLVYLGLPLLVDCVYSDEMRLGTLKNTVSGGTGRLNIYIGKFVAELLYMLLLMASAFLPMLVLNPSEAALTAADAFPLWLGGVAIAQLLYFLLSPTMAYTSYIVLFFLPPLIGQLLNILPGWCLYHHIMESNFVTTASLAGPWVTGLAWIAAALALGLLLFRRKEIR